MKWPLPVYNDQAVDYLIHQYNGDLDYLSALPMPSNDVPFVLAHMRINHKSSKSTTPMIDLLVNSWNRVYKKLLLMFYGSQNNR